MNAGHSRLRAVLAAAPRGIQPTVPQWQKSRGCMIMTAALELSGNQVTHFYSAKKNTGEMIRMMDVLIERYGTDDTEPTATVSP